MTMTEEEREDGREQRSEQRQPRLESHAIGHTTAAGHGLEAAVVHPPSLARERRRLEKAAPRLDAREHEVVPVDREHAEEKNPAAEESPAERHVRPVEAV